MATSHQLPTKNTSSSNASTSTVSSTLVPSQANSGQSEPISPVTVEDLIQMATATTISAPNNTTNNESVDATTACNKNNSSSSGQALIGPTLAGIPIAAPPNAKEQQYFTEIINGLFLTSANHITDENIATFRVTHIVNATRTVPLKRNVRSLRVNILDSAYENISSHFDTVSDFIHDAFRNKGRVAVHCISGISRSSTLVIAYLMKHKDMMLKDAFQLVRSRRWFIRPNTGFFRQLVEYELKLYGINTVKMVWSEAAQTHVPDFILEDNSNYKYFYLCIKK